MNIPHFTSIHDGPSIVGWRKQGSRSLEETSWRKKPTDRDLAFAFYNESLPKETRCAVAHEIKEKSQNVFNPKSWWPTKKEVEELLNKLR